jgi:hypothetical protein
VSRCASPAPSGAHGAPPAHAPRPVLTPPPPSPRPRHNSWEVIKAGGMQDASVKSQINVSGPLREALGCAATIKHTEILKVVQPHLTKIEKA